jgi:hypothetical protein
MSISACKALSARGDPLEAIDHLVPWESFHAEIEAVVLTADELKKSSAGRKPLDAILMFRMLVLPALNNLSDEHVEYLVREGVDRHAGAGTIARGRRFPCLPSAGRGRAAVRRVGQYRRGPILIAVDRYLAAHSPTELHQEATA